LYEVEVAVNQQGLMEFLLRFSNMKVTILSTNCFTLLTTLGPQGSYHGNGKTPPL